MSLILLLFKSFRKKKSQGVSYRFVVVYDLYCNLFHGLVLFFLIDFSSEFLPIGMCVRRDPFFPSRVLLWFSTETRALICKFSLSPVYDEVSLYLFPPRFDRVKLLTVKIILTEDRWMNIFFFLKANGKRRIRTMSGRISNENSEGMNEKYKRVTRRRKDSVSLFIFFEKTKLLQRIGIVLFFIIFFFDLIMTFNKSQCLSFVLFFHFHFPFKFMYIFSISHKT